MTTVALGTGVPGRNRADNGHDQRRAGRTGSRSLHQQEALEHLDLIGSALANTVRDRKLEAQVRLGRKSRRGEARGG
jgi:hypothetical protein